ncbi:hypothetical protein Plec18167_008390 [Paecilomyces lecythidis]|uniref:Glutamine amidotransferase type-2 domain-containing protein n=1 Tax=Paecilomyces lecythidis TaxID=3004212 RepID=A0ABR3WXN0_9EURO
MCGIFFSLSTSGPVLPAEETATLLRNRGPDSLQTHNIQLESPPGQDGVGKLSLTFISTVLALRGDHVHAQPLVDDASKSVLCWNGEAWKISNDPVQGNDTELIFSLLLDSVKAHNGDTASPRDSLGRICTLVSNISGPFSFVFYDGINSRVYFSRDCLGRRSLLQGVDEEGNLRICSICDGISSTHFEEVDTNGLHMIDLAHAFRDDSLDTTVLNHAGRASPFSITTIPWVSKDDTAPTYFLKNPIPPMNREVPAGTPPALDLDSPAVETLRQKLWQSLELRLRNVPEPPSYSKGHGSKVAVLFSGGLDCTVLARLAHEVLPADESIDLLNVAFENPRVAAAAAKSKTRSNESVYESCPDRMTGRAAHAELQSVCPGRTWRFVAIDVPYSETIDHRERVKRLMRPHNTEMDLSIACALYFASRGKGTVAQGTGDATQTAPYSTSARVLLSGLGADELFAGYGRHEVAFSRDGFKGLIDEIDLDVGRLGKRNLGRDDRVISHWGREARFPYLDEDFVAWAVQAPVWEKCGFGTSTLVPNGDASEGSDPALSASSGGEMGINDIEPQKRVLRLLALRLGMKNVAREKKRAIQFGARTAKMESGKSKGTHVLT